MAIRLPDMVDSPSSPCVRCGAPLSPGRGFCTACGAPQAAAPPVVPPPPAVPAGGCRACGAPLGGKRFCPTCGTQAVAGDAEATGPLAATIERSALPPAVDAPTLSRWAPAAPPAPPAAPGQRRRRGGPLLVALLVLVLLAGAGTAGYLVVNRGSDDPGTADPAVDPTIEPDADDEPAEPSVDPSTTLTAEPVTPPPPVTQAPPPVVDRATCWDGPAPRVADCTEPSVASQAAIEWVFPSLDTDSGTCVQEAGDRLQIWRCDTYLGGSPITLRYSAWRTYGELFEHYDGPRSRGDGTRIDVSGGRYEWLNYVPRKDQYKAAFAYRDALWSVTVYASSEALRAEAVRDLLVMRPATQRRGVRKP